VAYPVPSHFDLHRIGIVRYLVGCTNYSIFMGTLQMGDSHNCGIDGDICLSLGETHFSVFVNQYSLAYL
jgi:hypothetical protein